MSHIIQITPAGDRVRFQIIDQKTGDFIYVDLTKEQARYIASETLGLVGADPLIEVLKKTR